MEPPSATASESFGLIFGVHQFANGRLLVDDAGGRRLLLFDAALSKFTVVADPVPGSANSYGDTPSQIIDYIGDSVLFASYTYHGLLVIDPKGNIARVMAVPREVDLMRIMASRTVADSKGRLVYRGAYSADLAVVGRDPGTYLTQPSDSAPLVRADFDTRTVDTLGTLKVPVFQKSYCTVTGNGTVAYRVVITPLASADDWILTANGSVAFIRGKDYHIDWINADGARTSAPQMPFEWIRIPDQQKLALADAARGAAQQTLDEAKARAGPRAAATGGSVCITDVSAPIPLNTKIEAAPLSEILDFQPPVRPGLAKADPEGNIWILPSTAAKPAGGGIVYDVVNYRGELFQRVQMPPERSIAGFGPGGVVYLMWRGAPGAWHLEKSHVAR